MLRERRSQLGDFLTIDEQTDAPSGDVDLLDRDGLEDGFEPEPLVKLAPTGVGHGERVKANGRRRLTPNTAGHGEQYIEGSPPPRLRRHSSHALTAISTDGPESRSMLLPAA